MKVIRVLFPAIVILALMAACAPAGSVDTNTGNTGVTQAQSGGATVFEGTATIEIKNFAFSPQDATVKVGTEVTWINMDSASHNVTADDNSFESGTLGQNESFGFKFNTPGTFTYSCTTHPSMTATIIVVQ